MSVPAASRALAPVFALSSAIHVGLICVAVASQSTAPPLSLPRLVTEQVRFVALHVATAPAAVTPRGAGGRRGRPGAPPTEEAPPLPIPQLAFNVDLPPSIDPVVAPDYTYADLALIGRGVSDDDPLRLGIGSAARATPDTRYNAYDLSSVERGATPDPKNPKPHYPMAMLDRRAEVSFSVYFVVDTTGVVDRETLEVPRSVGAEFARAVLDVLFRWRFAPAEVGGRRVRQHVQQPFLFRVEQ